MYATGETWTPAALGGGVPGPCTDKGNIMKIARASVVSLLQLALFSTAHAVSQTDRVAAANDTANSITHPTNFCSGLRGPGFYWEIGTSGGPLSDPNLGTVGGDLNGEPRQDTLMKIASASKWIYAAYVVERFGASVLTPRDYEFLTLTSGYHSLETSCAVPNVKTVNDCLAQCSGSGGSMVCNSDFSNDAGEFFYDGGHFEADAGALNMFSVVYHNARLGSDAFLQLGPELQSYLSPGATGSWITFYQPLLAGGISMTARNYVDDFLRPVIAGTLQMSSQLGTHAVCTDTWHVDGNGQRICPSALYEPPGLCESGEMWHYSVGHWVEDDTDPTHGDDGAFNSAGSRGFYPWIWEARPPWNTYGWNDTLYGVVARDTAASGDPPPAQCLRPDGATTPEDTTSWESILCGRAIRKAFLTGIPQ